MTTTSALSARPPTLGVQLVVSGAGELANRLAQLCTIAMAGWMLGVSAVGVIGLAWSLTAIVQALVQGGPELAGTRLLALAEGTPAEQARIIADVTRLKLMLALAVAPLLMAIQIALGRNDTAALAQLAAQTAAMIAIGWGYAWAFRGVCRFIEQGAARGAQAVGSIALLWPLLLVWPSPLAVPVAEILAALLAVAVTRHRLWSLMGDCAPSSGRLRPLAVSALTVGFSGVLSALGWLMPILAAARWAPIEQISYLTGILRLLLGISGVMHIVLQSLYPLLARVQAADAVRGRDVTLALTLQATLATLAGVILLMATANIMLPLALGPEFIAAVPVFRALAPVLVPLALHLPLSYALIGRGETMAVARIQAAVTAAAIVGSLVAFKMAPNAWSVLVLHPVLWLQAMATMWVFARHNGISRPANGWGALFDPLTIGRLLHCGL
ncbi:MAG TPA: lipopolysaccharide biosynthesis protein [Azospirillaceae bacterium]|nr:lipopolysaccharide biosynthesis protein [Azospirillaceae bacterium]